MARRLRLFRSLRLNDPRRRVSDHNPQVQHCSLKKDHRIGSHIWNYIPSTLMLYLKHKKEILFIICLLSAFYLQGMYSFCQLMTASMPTFIGRNITGIRPTQDCFHANLGHIMTAFMPTLGLTA